MPIPVHMRAKEQVCSSLSAWIASSNPADGMNIRLLLFLVCCVGSRLRDGLITRSESYRVFVFAGLIACDLEISTRPPRPDLRLGVAPQKQKTLDVVFL
jgi:hypothetical protein